METLKSLVKQHSGANEHTVWAYTVVHPLEYLRAQRLVQWPGALGSLRPRANPPRWEVLE